jgi:titin
MTGANKLANKGDGVSLNDAAGNWIGGSVVEARNIISGNDGDGVYLRGKSDGNFVEGNYIGVDVDGQGKTGLGNGGNGVKINGGASNTIGGLATKAGQPPGNVISGNRFYGVSIEHPLATDNHVQGNLIGLAADGVTVAGNLSGVFLKQVHGNEIGGMASGAGNVISGNSNDGVEIRGAENRVQGNYIGIGVDENGDFLRRGNGMNGVSVYGSDNLIGGPATTPGQAPGNVISANAFNGVEIKTGTGNMVQGNIIGLNPTGSFKMGNGFNGVEVESASNHIGGPSTGLRNVISGNGVSNRVMDRNGVKITGAAATGNQVQGNYIGTDLAGATGQGNVDAGVLIEDAPDNLIGGTVAASGTAPGNVISGNQNAGVVIYKTGAKNNRVQGNLIGLYASGSLNVGNRVNGVLISDAPENLIGGATPQEGNFIGANKENGVAIVGAPSQNNKVQNNTIGADPTGRRAGNEKAGVLIKDAQKTLVGGPGGGLGNTIEYNKQGVNLLGAGAKLNVVKGNMIAFNTEAGVLIQSASDNLIGTTNGVSNPASNLIKSNRVGVEIKADSTGALPMNNQVLGNTLFANTDEGAIIDAGQFNTIKKNVLTSNGNNDAVIDNSGKTNYIQ